MKYGVLADTMLILAGVANLVAQAPPKKASDTDLSGVWQIQVNSGKEERWELKQRATQDEAYCGQSREPGRDGKEDIRALCTTLTKGAFIVVYGPAADDGRPIPLTRCEAPYKSEGTMTGSCVFSGVTVPFNASRQVKR
jgi:hypothetical protein